MTRFDHLELSSSASPIGSLLTRTDVLAVVLEASRREGLLGNLRAEAGRDGYGFVLLSGDPRPEEAMAFPDPWLDVDMDGREGIALMSRLLQAVLPDSGMGPIWCRRAALFCEALCEAYGILRPGLPPGMEGVIEAARLASFRRARGTLPWIARTPLSQYLDSLAPDRKDYPGSAMQTGPEQHGYLESHLARSLGIDPARLDPPHERRTSFQALRAAFGGSGSWSGPYRFLRTVLALRTLDARAVRQAGPHVVAVDSPFRSGLGDAVPHLLLTLLRHGPGHSGRLVIALHPMEVLDALRTRGERPAAGQEDGETAEVFSDLAVARRAIVGTGVADAVLRANAEDRAAQLHKEWHPPFTMADRLRVRLEDAMDRARLMAGSVGADAVLLDSDPRPIRQTFVSRGFPIRTSAWRT